MSGKVNICAGVNRKFSAYGKYRGCRTWHLIGESRSEAAVVRSLTAAMLAWRYREGKLVITEDDYEPTVILTVRKP
jgi:hypothetical protein